MTMTGPEIAATRHLLGLSQQELASMLHVGRSAVKDWERGRFTARDGVIADLLALRASHDHETNRLAEGAAAGIPIYLPDGPKPRGWYLALAARVLDREPEAQFEWTHDL